MGLKLDKQNLEELMKDFYILTGIKLVVFDNDYREILSYPQEHCPFCRLMQEHGESYRQCMDSNRKSFEHCKKSGELMIYHCHAGLVEATAPLIDNGIIIGYIMFGQITDIQEPSRRIQSLLSVCREYSFDKTDLEKIFLEITYKSREQIQAASKILETCTFYVLLKKMIFLEKQQFINKLNDYIESHIADDIGVSSLCEEFHIGRSKLYEAAAGYLGIGIAEYIRQKRIQKAKELLKNANDSVSEISQKVGFADYNYFCRVFKKEIGIPAKKYRRLNQ